MTNKELQLLGKQKAKDTIEFIELLKHTKGRFAGVNFKLLPWQRQIITDIYGTLREDGNRQYKNVYVEIAKKNGKSELVSALALKQLCADNEHFAEVYGCATDKQQASIIYDVAVDMVDREETLRKVIKPILSRKRLVYEKTKSFYQVLSADVKSKHGFNVSCCIFDEIHAQPHRELYDVMTFGSGDAREQPLFIFITTAGDDPDRFSIGWELHKKAADILTGQKQDPFFYPAIWGLDLEENIIFKGRVFEQVEKIDWKDSKHWAKVNPSIGHTIKTNVLVDTFKTLDNQAEEKLFRQLRLNIWNKYTNTKWMTYEEWSANTGIIDITKLRGRSCFAGLDLSSKLDLSAFVLIFPPEKEEEKYIILPFFWIPEENIKKRQRLDKVPYDEWLSKKLIIATPGNKIDYDFIDTFIRQISNKYDIIEIGYDPWHADQLIDNLDDYGLDMIEVRQNFQNLSPSMDDLEALILGKHLNHGNHEVLNWMFGNLEIVTDTNGNKRPTKRVKAANSKRKSGHARAKIDGIVAMLTGFTRVFASLEGSVYDEREEGNKLFSI